MFSHHEACPDCRDRGEDRSGDNLGVWKDGHKFCFFCGYHEESGSTLRIDNVKQRLSEKQEKRNINGRNPAGRIALPSDYSSVLPEVALKWLRKYGITDEEIKSNYLGWSNEDCSLVLPVFDPSGNLVMAQRRRFVSGRARYFTTGLPEATFHILGDLHNTHSVCVVEDLISAIKVARVIPAMPLWGSSISQHRAWILGQRFDNLIIWLDADKAKYAIGKRNSLAPFFNGVRVVVTEQDPKCYSTDELKEVLK